MLGAGYTLLVALDSIAEKSNKAVLLSGTVVFGASIGYSRFFLGLHSSNQIIYGSLLGIWLATSIHYIFRADMIRHLNKVLKLVDQDYTSNSVYALVSLAAMMTTLIANYYLVETNDLPEWITRI